jgi:hypothetical protein
MPASKSRLQEAMEELEDWRNEGDDICEWLEYLADNHKVPLESLRAAAEKKWGAPLETDKARNASDFVAIANRKKHEEFVRDVDQAAREHCIEIWSKNRPDAEIEWAREAEEFLKAFPGLSDNEKRPVRDFFRYVGREFWSCKAVFNRLKTARPYRLNSESEEMK